MSTPVLSGRKKTERNGVGFNVGLRTDGPLVADLRMASRKHNWGVLGSEPILDEAGGKKENAILFFSSWVGSLYDPLNLSHLWTGAGTHGTHLIGILRRF